jgi:hypothetical protein
VKAHARAAKEEYIEKTKVIKEQVRELEFEKEGFEVKINRLKLDIVVFKWCNLHKLMNWRKCDPESKDYIKRTVELEFAFKHNVRERVEEEHYKLV